jgi:hypothetical protein
MVETRFLTNLTDDFKLKFFRCMTDEELHMTGKSKRENIGNRLCGNEAIAE